MLSALQRLFQVTRGRRTSSAARRPALLAAGVATIGLMGWGAFAVFASSPVAHIVRPGGGISGDGEQHTEPNLPYTFGGLVICLDRPGKAVIDHIVPYKPTGGLRIDDFVAIPNPFELSQEPFSSADDSIKELSQPGSSPHIAYTGNGRVIDHQCPKSFNGPPPASGPVMKMLYVQFSKPTTATARDEGVAIDYTSVGKQFIYIVPWYVVLCGQSDTSSNCT